MRRYGLIRDAPFFEWLEAHVDRLLARDPEAVAYAVQRSCINKAEVVAGVTHGPAAIAILETATYLQLDFSLASLGFWYQVCVGTPTPYTLSCPAAAGRMLRSQQSHGTS